MGIAEQKEVKKVYHNEALRYMANARETLKKAGKDGKFYVDKKYVKTACGIAYNGVLEALDGLFVIKNISLPKTRRKSIEFYKENISKIDKKLLKDVNSAYNVLHLFGYYDGETYIPVIQSGLELAEVIIKRIEP